jgi:hypothetical protein
MIGVLASHEQPLPICWRLSMGPDFGIAILTVILTARRVPSPGAATGHEEWELLGFRLSF